MAKVVKKQESEDFVEHMSLHFDLKNPRTPDQEFTKEDDLLKYLIKHADVDELVTSIQSSNWVDFEPLIVQRSDNTVFEGNRRLAALRLLSSQDIRSKFGYNLPNDSSVVQLPEKVRVRWVDGRAEARSFIAFKHINGPFKWDALAKAKYAASWLDEGEEATKVAKQIGDTHNTVLRLVNGWRVLEQAIKEGFQLEDITARRFNFSHLYTALARPNTRTFLGLPDEPTSQLSENPVPEDNLDQLSQLMGWLFGQTKEGRQHVIKSQNPDLNRLVKVLGNNEARFVLTSTKDFTQAVEKVEPASGRFEESLSGAASLAEKALGLVSHYNPSEQPTLIGTVKGLATTVKSLRDLMKNKSTDNDDEL